MKTTAGALVAYVRTSTADQRAGLEAQITLRAVLAQRDDALATVHEVLQTEDLPYFAATDCRPSANMETTDFCVEEISRAVVGA